ncbi:MAG: serine/threonine protein kinase [Acidobacteriia bacterium]|nr:serine/threonine protein kinase [Terriglobia bacterium]
MGIVTPAYPDNFFFTDTCGKRREKDGRWFTGEKSRSRLPPEEKGHFLNYLLVCAKMARAVRKMHNHGLAHSDLSNKNVLIDPRNGSALLIDMDALVVPGIAPPTVLGTRGYIAPEVVAGKGLPQIDTDRHALAVLIYETLLLRHPIHGPKVHDTDPDVDDAMLFGEKALFVEHPTDKSNALSPAPAVPVSRLGPPLAELFYLAFVDGLHNKHKRPVADRWESAIYHTLDLLHPSPGGGEWFVLAPEMPMKCPFTQQAIQHRVPFARFLLERKPGNVSKEKRTLTIYNGLRLMKWHTVVGCSPGEDADSTEQGYFQLHNGRWWLTNKTGISIEVINGVPVPSGSAVELKSGLKIRFPHVSQRPGQPSGSCRVLEFDFMTP